MTARGLPVVSAATVRARRAAEGARGTGRKGANGVGTHGVAAKFMFFCWQRDLFGVLPFSYFYIPQSARVYVFPPIRQNSLLFAAAPLVLTPFVRSQHTLTLEPPLVAGVEASDE